MQQKYLDAMAIARKFGKADLFITFTANPEWPEITSNLSSGQTPADIPLVVCRVFKHKLESLIKEITKENIFGVSVANIHVIEFQKRGLPHAHILVMLR